MNVLASRLLRVILVVLLLGTVLAQILLPVFGSEEGRIYPELAYLVVPYSVAGILAIACGQVALLVVWRLLSMVNGGVIFTRRALRWVDVITACAAVATVLSTGPMIHLLFFVGVGGPLILWLLACLAGGLAFVLLMLVLRGPLESAIADRTELDEVI
ncbi:MAG TPA: DUF2975 domain-containing protein [Candidatus Deferrimicrobium sp.]|nr:DUF2975 domain-containing protein [Candidatus Deferrimicrobium sp.]